ncbi:hypothetical protein [Mycobacterium tuberculosis]|uniref:hypothetical protein n=1 Tax=Mycobacterium tuberculosis TaxID=1773 RepID=UPI00272C2D44|nr:hypothetical protein [Mycobacterium tuberculosis]
MSAVVYCGSMGDWPLLTTEQRMEGVRSRCSEAATRTILRLQLKLPEEIAEAPKAGTFGPCESMIALALFRGRNEDDPALAAQAARGDRRSAEGGHLR